MAMITGGNTIGGISLAPGVESFFDSKKSQQSDLVVVSATPGKYQEAE